MLLAHGTRDNKLFASTSRDRQNLVRVNMRQKVALLMNVSKQVEAIYGSIREPIVCGQVDERKTRPHETKRHVFAIYELNILWTIVLVDLLSVVFKQKLKFHVVDDLVEFGYERRPFLDFVFECFNVKAFFQISHLAWHLLALSFIFLAFRLYESKKNMVR
jgi:hypothetical protein